MCGVCVCVQVPAACEGGAVDEEDGVHLHRVQQIRSLQREGGSQVSETPAVSVSHLSVTY